MPRTGRRLKGQAEVIGGVIVITALIISMGFVLTSLGKLSSSSVTGISRRALFETEKSYELMDAIVSGGVCYIRNTGNTPLMIIRLWSRDKPIDISPGLYPAFSIQPGGNKSIEEIKSIFNIEKIDYIVTSRGNVFPAESMCKQQQANVNIFYYYYEITGGGLFASEHILNSTKIVQGLTQGYIYVDIQGEGTRAVIYNYSNTWYCSSMTNKSTIQSQTLRTDADENGIHELIVTRGSACIQNAAYSEWGARNFAGRLTMVFRNIINVSQYPDILNVYFKVIIIVGGGGVAQQVAIYPSVTLYNEYITLQSPATVTTGGSRINVATVFGTAIFPVRAFSQEVSTGVYNLNITLQLTGQSIEITGVRLEYVAIVGADYSTYWIFG